MAARSDDNWWAEASGDLDGNGQRARTGTADRKTCGKGSLRKGEARARASEKRRTPQKKEGQGLQLRNSGRQVGWRTGSGRLLEAGRAYQEPQPSSPLPNATTSTNADRALYLVNHTARAALWPLAGEENNRSCAVQCPSRCEREWAGDAGDESQTRAVLRTIPTLERSTGSPLLLPPVVPPCTQSKWAERNGL